MTSEIRENVDDRLKEVIATVSDLDLNAMSSCPARSSLNHIVCAKSTSYKISFYFGSSGFDAAARTDVCPCSIPSTSLHLLSSRKAQASCTWSRRILGIDLLIVFGFSRGTGQSLIELVGKASDCAIWNLMTSFQSDFEQGFTSLPIRSGGMFNDKTRSFYHPASH